MKTVLNNFCWYSLIAFLIILPSGCTSISLSATVDLIGPQFEFSIINLSNNQMIKEGGATIEVIIGEELELIVKALDYDEKADNMITVSLFDFEEAYKNQKEVSVTIPVSDIAPGKYPASVVFERIIESTETNKWAGIPKNERTMYVVVK